MANSDFPTTAFGTADFDMTVKGASMITTPAMVVVATVAMARVMVARVMVAGATAAAEDTAADRRWFGRKPHATSIQCDCCRVVLAGEWPNRSSGGSCGENSPPTSGHIQIRPRTADTPSRLRYAQQLA